MIRSFERFGIALGFVVLLSRAGSAWAQGDAAPTTDPKEMARRQGEEALALHAQGKFAEAYARFETAERIAHSPVFLLWMARSKRALGELGAAKRHYARVVAESLPADASPNWTQAKKAAEAELAALSPRIPTVEVKTPPGTSRLTLDGAPITAGAVVEVDPGDHEVVYTPEGGAPTSRRIHVAEGEPRVLVRFDEPRTDAVPGARSEGSVIPGAVLLGVGVGSVLAGAVTGAYALVLAGQVKEGCDDQNRCLASDQGKAEDADTLARASTGLFIAGGVLSAVGVVLVIVRPGGEPSTALRLGPTWAGLDVRF